MAVRILHSFIIRPDKRGTWKRRGALIGVNIVRTAADIRKAYGKDAGDCLAFVRYARGRVQAGIISVMWFPETRALGCSLVAHEASHAALSFMSWDQTGRAYNAKFLMDEEKFAMAVGNVVHELTCVFYRLGVWK